MKKPFLLSLLVLTSVISAASLVRIKDSKGTEVLSYSGSYALVIGNSDYTNGWWDLPGVKKDIEAIRKGLIAQGFQVVLRENLTKEGLDRAFDDFIQKYGRGDSNRLLFYVASHGATIQQPWGKKRALGYLVGVDAPTAATDLTKLDARSLSLKRIEEYALRIRSKHALFVFDSCFSGSLFSLSKGEDIHIAKKTALPVRQFLTSGSADERVADNGLFREQFLVGIGGEADLYKDGYVTGTELGKFLSNKMINYSKGTQTPQFGTIIHPDLDKGDFVFKLSKEESLEKTKQTPSLTFYAKGSEIRGLLAKGREIDVMKASMLFEGLKLLPNSDPLILDQLTKQIQQAYRTVYAKPRPTVPAAPRVAGKLPTQVTNSTGIEFVLIPPGEFKMGSTEAEKERVIQLCEIKGMDSKTCRNFCKNENLHHAKITQPIYLSKTEITQAQWKAVMGSETWKYTEEAHWFSAKHPDPKIKQNARARREAQDTSPDHPVIFVSWKDVHGFIKRLNRLQKCELRFVNGEGRLMQGCYRLPTEAEWEYAARAGTHTARYWGDNPDRACEYANVASLAPLKLTDWKWNTPHNCDDGIPRLGPVARYKPNTFGLYDMLGNVAEWTLDSYQSEFIVGEKVIDPINVSRVNGFVVRGGSWADSQWAVRSAFRTWNRIKKRSDKLGFRLARIAKMDSVSTITSAGSQSKSVKKHPGVQRPVTNQMPNQKSFTNSIGTKFVLIPAGSFSMGSSKREQNQAIEECKKSGNKEQNCRISMDPEVQHEAAISRPFYLGIFEVTQKEWRSVMGSDTWKVSKEYKASQVPVQTNDLFAVSFINYSDIWEFIQRLNYKEGCPVGNVEAFIREKGLQQVPPGCYRLPTEAEWEYAARAGTQTSRFWGEGAHQACKFANVGDLSFGKNLSFESFVHQCYDRSPVYSVVGNYQPNQFGLYDMLGNLAEWVVDAYAADYYSRSPKTDTVNLDFTLLNSIRGGAFMDQPWATRSALRSFGRANLRDMSTGFRLVRVFGP